jgi:hypothetical protein
MNRFYSQDTPLYGQVSFVLRGSLLSILRVPYTYEDSGFYSDVKVYFSNPA